MWEWKKHIGGALTLVLLFLLPSGTPSAVSRLCREGLLGSRPHPASGMVRWKVGSLESELWSRGLGRRVPDSDPGLNGTEMGIGLTVSSSQSATLDLKSKEEKDAELDKRIEALRRKNEALIRRYQVP